MKQTLSFRFCISLRVRASFIHNGLSDATTSPERNPEGKITGDVIDQSSSHPIV